MTERERWIVYPLLFLAISASLKDKFVAPDLIRAKRIVANNIEVNQVKVYQKLDATMSSVGAKMIEANVVKANQVSAGITNTGQLLTLRAVIHDTQNQPKIVLQFVPDNANESDNGNGGHEADDSGLENQSSEGNGDEPVVDDGQESDAEQQSDAEQDDTENDSEPSEIVDANDENEGDENEGGENGEGESDGDQTNQQVAAAEPVPTSGQIIVLGTDLRDLVRVGSGPAGGYLVTKAKQEGIEQVVLGHHMLGAGLFWLDKDGRIRKVEAVRLINPVLNLKNEDEERPEVPVPE